MAIQVLQDFISKVTQKAKFDAGKDLEAEYKAEIVAVYATWDKDVRALLLKGSPKAKKKSKSKKATPQPAQKKAPLTEAEKTVISLIKDIDSLQRLMEGLTKKNLTLSAGLKKQLSIELKKEIPSDIDTVINTQLSTAFKVPNSFSVQIYAMISKTPTDLFNLEGLLAHTRSKSTLPGISGVTKYNYGIKSSLKALLEPKVLSAIANLVISSNNSVTSQAATINKKVDSNSSEIKEYLAKRFKDKFSVLAAYAGLSVQDLAKGLVDAKFKIPEKDRRDAYKAFVHVFDLGLFFEKLAQDLKDIGSECAVEPDTNALKKIFASSVNRLPPIHKPDAVDDNWSKGDGFGIWLPVSLTAIANKDALLNLLLYSYDRNVRDIVLHDREAELVLDYIGRDNLEKTKFLKAKSSAQRPMEKTTKLAGYISRDLGRIAYEEYHAALKAEKAKVPGIVAEERAKGQVVTDQEKKDREAATRVPLEAATPFSLLFAFGSSRKNIDSPENLFKFYNREVESSTQFAEAILPIFHSGHINPAVGYDAWVYGLRHYTHNSYNRKSESTSLKDFYTQEAKYFGVIADELTNLKKEFLSNNLEFEQGVSSLAATDLTNLVKSDKDSKLPKKLSNLLWTRLYGEVLSSNITFFRSMSQAGALHTTMKVFIERRKVQDVKPEEFVDLAAAVAEGTFSMTVVTHPELASLNQGFGNGISRVHTLYQDRLLQSVADRLQSQITSDTGELRKGELSGSPSMKDIIVKTVFDTLTKGKSALVKITSKASAKTRPEKRQDVKIKSTVSIRKISTVNSSNQTLLNKLAPSIPRAPRAPAKQTQDRASSTKKPEVLKTKIKKLPTLRETNVRSLNPPNGVRNKTRLRGGTGVFTSVTNIHNLLQLGLFETIKRNMVSPKLNFRTGRLAKSAEIKSITHGNDDVVDIRYTYMRNPYGTFEPGGRQGSPSRDPKALISGSIREVLRGQVLQRLRITRV